MGVQLQCLANVATWTLSLREMDLAPCSARYDLVDFGAISSGMSKEFSN